jgi:hypothetical protein
VKGLISTLFNLTNTTAALLLVVLTATLLLFALRSTSLLVLATFLVSTKLLSN